MRERREFVSLSVAAAGALLAGCLGDTDGNGSGSGPTTADPGGSATSGSGGATDGSDGSPTPEDLRYAESWTGHTIEKGSGWIIELPEFDGGSQLSYSVTAGESVRFDVYVFAEEFTKREYERWINAPSGMRPETNGIVGRSGATARDVSGSVERENVLIDPGRWWIAVDHSNFDGGDPRAEAGDDSPDAITVDVSVRVVATGF